MSLESIEKSRIISDGELLKGGAEFVLDDSGKRLEITAEQLTALSGQDKRTKSETESSVNEFNAWIQAHPYQFLSFIISNYGSLEAFRQEVEADTRNRFAKPAHDQEPQAA